MTIFMMTAEQHAQVLDALEESQRTSMYVEVVIETETALAMLKAMQPQEPVAWMVAGKYSTMSKTIAEIHRDDGQHVANLYTPTKD
jgi:hypothetical protein